jgi:hypothetical protein
MQSYETKTFGKLSSQPISLQTLNGKTFRTKRKQAALVKGLRRIPFTDESRVRFPYAVQNRVFKKSTNYNPLIFNGQRIFYLCNMMKKTPLLHRLFYAFGFS